ncbi:MAG: hypothetical protein D6744_15855 [Planctomycetota bacterium]|nr:MAG: hypothetical protein D6744_15855 [Planctomycetota bacterium]
MARLAGVARRDGRCGISRFRPANRRVLHRSARRRRDRVRIRCGLVRHAVRGRARLGDGARRTGDRVLSRRRCSARRRAVACATRRHHPDADGLSRGAAGGRTARVRRSESAEPDRRREQPGAEPVSLLRWAQRAMIRAAVWPTLAINRAMCLLGVWRKWDWVDDAVLLGARPSRRDIARLHALGVRAIVNMCEEFGGHTRLLRRCGIEQLHLPTLDYHSPTVEDLRRAVAFIGRHAAAGERVYVHCKAGRGRAATVATAYVAITRNIDVREAEERVRSVRPQIDRNLAQRDALRVVVQGWQTNS